MTTNPGTLPLAILDTLEASAAWNLNVQNQRYLQEIFADTSNEGLGIDPMAVLGCPWYGRNLLVNGGMEIAQRPGTSFVCSGALPVCPADGWEAFSGTWTRDTTVTDSSGTSLKCVPDGLNQCFLTQTIYNVEQYRGKRVSMWCRVNGALGYANLNDVQPGGGSVVNSLVRDATGGWTTLGTTITVSATATSIQASWGQLGNLTAPIYFDNFMCTMTDGPVPFQPTQPALDWNRVKARYFQVPFSCRFRASAAGQVETYTVMLPLPVIAVLGASCPLTGVATVDFSNVTGAPVVTIDNTSDGCALRVAVTAASASDTWLFKQPLAFDAGVF